MKNNNIDDMLKIVSSNLVTGYESKHLKGITLRSMNEERASVGSGPSITLFWAFTLYILAAVISLFWTIVCVYYGRSWYIVCSLPIVLILPIFYYMAVPLQRRLRIATKCEPILENFRNAVTALNPLGVTIREYNETSVRDILVTLAVRILDAESKFDAARVQKERRTFDILHYGSWLEKCQEQFEKTSQQAKEFGLEFNNGDLFADAKKHIERTNRLLAKS